MHFGLVNFILFMGIACVALFLTHIAVVRSLLFMKKDPRDLKVLAFCVVFIDIAVVSVFALFFKGDLPDLIYVFIVFNCLAFFYFQIFNLSETARRIKIIVNIKKGNIKNRKDVETFYSTTDVFRNRIVRLKELSQIRETAGGKLRLSSKFFYFIAEFILFFRKMLGFGNHVKSGRGPKK